MTFQKSTVEEAAFQFQSLLFLLFRCKDIFHHERTDLIFIGRVWNQ